MFGDPLSNSKGWCTEEIGSLFEVITRGKQPSYIEHSDICVINQACIYWDGFNLRNVKYHNANSNKGTLTLSDGCILINSTGTGTLGRCNVFRIPNKQITYVADSHVTVLSGSEKVNAFFFKSFFRSEDVQKKIYAECVNGSTNQIELSKQKLSQVMLIVPPMELQDQFEAFVRQSDKSKFVLQIGEIKINEVIMNGGKI